MFAELRTVDVRKLLQDSRFKSQATEPAKPAASGSTPEFPDLKTDLRLIGLVSCQFQVVHPQPTFPSSQRQGYSLWQP